MMTMQEAVDRFLADNAAYCLPKTMEYYSENVGHFADWFAKTGRSVLDDVQPDEMVVYQTHLRTLRTRNGRPLKNTSVNTYMRAVRRFFRWLQDEGIMDLSVRRPRRVKDDADQIIPLTAAEIRRIESEITFMSAKKQHARVYRTRNLLILHLMLDQGLRKSEVRGLCWRNFDFEKRLLIVEKGKGCKDRVLPLSGIVRDLLVHYRDWLPKKSDHDSVLFYDVHLEKPITDNTIKQLFQRLKERSGIDRLHPHLLRHTFATSFIMCGGDVSVLRVLLGHSDFVITQRYLHLASQFTIAGTDVYQLDPVLFYNKRAAGV